MPNLFYETQKKQLGEALRDLRALTTEKWHGIRTALDSGQTVLEAAMGAEVNTGVAYLVSLQMDEKKVLLLFTRKIYPEIDRRPERQIISRLYEAIFTDTSDIDPRTVVLLSLARSANILPILFDRKLLKTRKARIEQVVNGEVTGQAAKEAIEAMQSAVFVACMLPVITASCAH